MKLLRYALVLIAFTSFTISCKSAKNVAKTDTTKASQIKISQQLIKSANFSNISVNLSINGNTLGSRASMRIITDSVIQLSLVPALGIEIARINFTPDSILVADKINQKYLVTSYDSLLTKINLPLGFTDLQAFFLNKLFVAGEKTMSFEETLNRFTSSPFPDGTMLKGKMSNRGVNTDFVVNKETNISMATILFPAAVVRCNYTGFEKQDGVNFPRNLKIVFMQGPKSNQAEIEINQVEFNKAVRINQIDLSNYTRASTIDQIIPN